MTEGSYSTFVGHEAGQNSDEDFNTFVGYQSGISTTSGYRNTFLGFQAGSGNTTGSGNTYIGAHAGDSYSTISNQLVIGNKDTRTWLRGDITSSGNLYVNGQSVTTTSSRFLKKNIKPFKDFKKALEDIINTPLFTYQYKNKYDHPDKTRMGIISEELPKHLQIISQGQLSHPDWPSIYGSFWAAIKALYGMLTSLKNDVLSKIKSLKSRFDKFKESQREIMEEFMKFKLEVSTIQKELSNKKKEVEITNRTLKVQSERMTAQFEKIYKDFENTKRDIFLIKKALRKDSTKVIKRKFSHNSPLARISHKVSLRDRSNACPIRLRGQKDAEGIPAVRRREATRKTTKPIAKGRAVTQNESEFIE